jgi:putative GTP pyrophosphokinase
MTRSDTDRLISYAHLEKNEGLPEYESLGDLKFEIQVRTVLQHAWAELAHDRSFKFGTTLPTKIQRRLNLYAGMLEIVDSSFDAISKEIDLYKQFLDSKTISQIEKVEIDSISLSKFVSYIAHRNKIKLEKESYPTFLIREIKESGVSNVGDLKKLASPAFFKAYVEKTSSRESVSLIRLLLLYNDIRNLDVMRSVKRFSPKAFDVLAEKHGKNTVEKEMAKRGITISEPSVPAETASTPVRKTSRSQGPKPAQPSN